MNNTISWRIKGLLTCTDAPDRAEIGSGSPGGSKRGLWRIVQWQTQKQAMSAVPSVVETVAISMQRQTRPLVALSSGAVDGKIGCSAEGRDISATSPAVKAGYSAVRRCPTARSQATTSPTGAGRALVSPWGAASRFSRKHGSRLFLCSK